MNSMFISSSKSTAPIPMMKRIAINRKESVKPVNVAPNADTSTPMVVKERASPETIARGRSLCPAEPEKTTGTSGRQHGFIMVTMPARKTRNIEGAKGSMCDLTCAIDGRL
jgi:hypothetical protein